MTFSINDKIKFLENLKQGFKRTIFWNKHRSEIITQLKTNNLGCMIDPTFRNVNISFFFCLKLVTMILQGVFSLDIVRQPLKLKILMC